MNRHSVPNVDWPTGNRILPAFHALRRITPELARARCGAFPVVLWSCSARRSLLLSLAAEVDHHFRAQVEARTPDDCVGVRVQ